MNPRLPNSTFALAAIACVASVCAQEIKPDANPKALDPGRVYFVAWEEKEAGKKLQKLGETQKAQEKYRESKRLFDLLAKFHGDYHPALVQKRQDEVAAAIIGLREAVAAKDEQEKKALAGLLQEGPATSGAQDAVNKLGNPKNTRERSLMASNEKLTRERDQALRDAEIARKQRDQINPVKGRFDKMNRQLLKLQIERRALEKELKKARDNKIELNAEFLRAQASIETQAKKLKKLKEAQKVEKQAADELIESQMKRITSLEEQLQESQKEAAHRELKIAQLQKRLDESGILLKEVTYERNQLKMERDNLATMLELNDPNHVKGLIDEKVKLLSQLNRAKDRIKELEADEIVEGESLAQAKTDIALLKKRLLQVQEENIAYSKQVSDLGKRLRTAEDQLTKLEQEPEVSPASIEEAKMLREVVAKMRKAAVAREKGIERMVSVAQRLQLKDPEFQHILAALKGEKVTLTAEEQAIVSSQEAASDLIQGNTNFYPEYSRPDIRTVANNHRELKQDIEAHERLARRAYRKGNYETSAEFFETILSELHPDHFESLCNLGAVRLKLKQPSKAAENFETAAIYREDHPFPHLMLGISFYKMGEDDRAKEALQKGITLDPANVNGHIILASVSTRQGQLDDAIHELQTAVKLQPDNPTAHFNLAYLYADTGKMDDARKHYDLAIKEGALPDPDLATRLKANNKQGDS